MAERQTTCVVVGGGPAGMFLALLLARAGVPVTVLEKHGDGPLPEHAPPWAHRPSMPVADPAPAVGESRARSD
jgi:cation diffusion facilitator CzcD-associated flavoprotein CzcO